MRNLSVISKSPNGRAYHSDTNHNNKSSNKPNGTIQPATNGNGVDVGDIDIRARLYNPQAAAKIRRLAAENSAKNGPFDLVAFENFIKDHPLFSKLHLVVHDDEDAEEDEDY